MQELLTSDVWHQLHGPLLDLLTAVLSVAGAWLVRWLHAKRQDVLASMAERAVQQAVDAVEEESRKHEMMPSSKMLKAKNKAMVLAPAAHKLITSDRIHAAVQRNRASLPPGPAGPSN